MSTYPMSPKEMTGGLMYFPRVLDKIRMHRCGNLPADYHENFWAGTISRRRSSSKTSRRLVGRSRGLSLT